MKKRTFVKYRNRKLHEVGVNSSYITMEDLTSVVAKGTPIQIVDDETGDDITSFTMARMVYERSRSDRNAYTVDELQKLIMTSPPKKKAA